MDYWCTSIYRFYRKKNGITRRYIIETNVGSQNRLLKKEKSSYMVQYIISKELSKMSSYAIYKNQPMLFFSTESFSNIFRFFFAAHIVKIPYGPSPEYLDVKFITDNLDTFIPRKKESSINSLQSFIENTLGYIHLTLLPKFPGDHFQHITIDNIDYSIVNGIYISPYAKSILLDNPSKIDGILMDTTWRVINKYVTSILMVTSYNVGIPIAFAFGESEDKKLYSLFIKEFNERLNIDLKQYVVESDQGTALKAVCDTFQKIHLACLRHFLVSLGSHPFSYQIGKLISCRNDFELDTLIAHYNSCFKKIEDEKMLKDLRKVLTKIGMSFDENGLHISNLTQWKKISVKERISLRMPSTTNALESTHGHINAKLPRRNEFWFSLHRLVVHLTSKDLNFSDRLKANYNRAKRISLRRAAQVSRALIEKECEFFSTTIESCSCAETILESSMLRIDLPCSHRLFKGAVYPDSPDVTINMSLDSPDTKCKNVNTIINVEYNPPQRDSFESLKKDAVRNIIRFGKGKKSDVEKFVAENFSTEEEGFVLGRPLFYYKLIHQGIMHFRGFE